MPSNSRPRPNINVVVAVRGLPLTVTLTLTVTARDPVPDTRDTDKNGATPPIMLCINISISDYNMEG